MRNWWHEFVATGDGAKRLMKQTGGDDGKKIAVN